MSELTQGQGSDGEAADERQRGGSMSVPEGGSTLVLVGDLDPTAAADAVADALSGWTASGTAPESAPAWCSTELRGL